MGVEETPLGDIARDQRRKESGTVVYLFCRRTVDWANEKKHDWSGSGKVRDLNVGHRGCFLVAGQRH